VNAPGAPTGSAARRPFGDDGGVNIATARLILRRPTWRDTPFIFRLIGDDRVRRYLGGPVPLHRRYQFLRDCLRPGPDSLVWTVFRKPQKQAIGVISITPHKDGHDRELSYQFHPDHWRQGFAFEATSAILAFSRQNFGPTPMIAETQSANLPSCQLLARLGMTERCRVIRYGAEQVIFQTGTADQIAGDRG
jgi:[ribosomal protein S5]-alanine N-acetyltransferase